jgi:hypothetical protein
LDHLLKDMEGVNRLDLDPETAISLIETKIIEKL